jgi:hypothetical protein
MKKSLKIWWVEFGEKTFFLVFITYIALIIIWIYTDKNPVKSINILVISLIAIITIIHLAWLQFYGIYGKTKIVAQLLKYTIVLLIITFSALLTLVVRDTNFFNIFSLIILVLYFKDVMHKLTTIYRECMSEKEHIGMRAYQLTNMTKKAILSSLLGEFIIISLFFGNFMH